MCDAARGGDAARDGRLTRVTLPGPGEGSVDAWLDELARRAAAAYPGVPEPSAYGPAPEQIVDFWGAPDAAVVVVMIHGGYFAAEYDRSGIEPLCRRLVAEGFGVANVEYRRTGSGDDPHDSVDDVRRAVRWVGDSRPSARLVLVGHSAGGYLALTGSTEPRVRAAVALAPATLLREISDGGYDDGALSRWLRVDGAADPRTWDRMQPERVGVGPVPLRVLHGVLDDVVPSDHSVRWAQQRAAGGEDVTVELLEGTGHYEFLDPTSTAAEAVVAAVRASSESDSLPWEEISRRFVAARNWWVVTSGSGGPHAVPVWGIVLDGAFVLYGETGSVRGRNLAGDPRVVLHLESGDDVLVVHGTAHDVGAAGGREVVNREFARKYTAHGDAEYLPDAPANAGSRLWEVTPVRALAWRVVPSPEWTTRRWRAGGAPPVRPAYGSPEPRDA